MLLTACTFSSPEPDPDPDPGSSPDAGVDPTDPDGDGVRERDNCPMVANADQRDDDDDEVGDACDNCATAANPRKATMGFDAPIQRDHDLDGRGDECDLCPHLTAPDADQDLDLIGDACDPEPAVANPPAYWNGFYEPPGSDWQAADNAGSKGDWELALRGDKLGWRQRVLDEQRHQLVRDGDLQESFVQSSIVIEAIDPGVNLPSATVTYGFYRQSGSDYYFSCGPRRNAGAGSDLIVAAVQNGGTDMASGNVSWSDGLPGVTIDVTARADRDGGGGPRTGDSDIKCSVPARDAIALDSTLFPDGRVGLRAFGMTAWFDYVFAVEPRPRP